ncbi:hypothetical protein DDE18_20950 [Nocardioides gansuensis]|uniref:Uridine kinase n=1 Tax=Nocardioides gansuensis TaxID=2138300 RepID=A0A2T8F5A0_9ACTN|nr:hypothetical protein DDE18_20950 [Nocardioides gansuensis]
MVLVDGRSGSGKSTFAAHAADLLEGCVVSTDDIAWNHAMFEWTDVLLAGVLQPWRRGEAVKFRPPAWESHDREGSIAVESGVSMIVEGVGAARAGLAGLADLAVWVQSDLSLARTRGLARDVSQGTRTPAEAEAFWGEWMMKEEPFLAADRPWERVHLWVLGTPPDGQTWIRDGVTTQ